MPNNELLITNWKQCEQKLKAHSFNILFSFQLHVPIFAVLMPLPNIEPSLLLSLMPFCFAAVNEIQLKSSTQFRLQLVHKVNVLEVVVAT